MNRKSAKEEVHVHDVSKLKGELKPLGGSMSDDWNNMIANQAVRSLWFFESTDSEEIKRQRHASVDALIGIKPRDELEGMLAAQLVACHNASMECFRRAMLREQTFAGREQNLNQANKLSRTYTALLDSLNRHRGKGQQKVTVEHVHVHEGGQAIVGNVEGGGMVPKRKEQPHALAHARGQTMPSPDAARDRMQIASHEERTVPDARRGIPGRSERQS